MGKGWTLQTQLSIWDLLVVGGWAAALPQEQALVTVKERTDFRAHKPPGGSGWAHPLLGPPGGLGTFPGPGHWCRPMLPPHYPSRAGTDSCLCQRVGNASIVGQVCTKFYRARREGGWGVSTGGSDEMWMLPQARQPG